MCSSHCPRMLLSWNLCSCWDSNANEELLGPFAVLCGECGILIREQHLCKFCLNLEKYHRPPYTKQELHGFRFANHWVLYLCENVCRLGRDMPQTYRAFHIRLDTELMALILRCLPKGCGLDRSSVLLGWSCVRSSHFFKKIALLLVKLTNHKNSVHESSICMSCILTAGIQLNLNILSSVFFFLDLIFSSSPAMCYLHAVDWNMPAALCQRTADDVGAAAVLPLIFTKKKKKKNMTIQPWLSWHHCIGY